MTAFRIRCTSIFSLSSRKLRHIRLLTSPFSVFDRKTNISWYLYTQELIQ